MEGTEAGWGGVDLRAIYYIFEQVEQLQDFKALFSSLDLSIATCRNFVEK